MYTAQFPPPENHTPASRIAQQMLLMGCSPGRRKLLRKKKHLLSYETRGEYMHICLGQDRTRQGKPSPPSIRRPPYRSPPPSIIPRPSPPPSSSSSSSSSSSGHPPPTQNTATKKQNKKKKKPATATLPTITEPASEQILDPIEEVPTPSTAPPVVELPAPVEGPVLQRVPFCQPSVPGLSWEEIREHMRAHRLEEAKKRGRSAVQRRKQSTQRQRSSSRGQRQEPTGFMPSACIPS